MQKSTSWDNSADWYDAYLSGEDTYQSRVIMPNLVRLAAPRAGLRVLDLACGQGFFARELQKLGAHLVGTDISSELIARARTLSSHEITYHVAPADNMPFLKDASIDLITFVLAIQNIVSPDAVLQECARLLAPDGRMLIVLNHPAFRIPKASSWGYDDAAHVEYRRLDGYLRERKELIQMRPGTSPHLTTVSFHRSLQVYAKLLRNAGLCITGLEEWISDKTSDSGPRARAENRARKEFPLFLCIEAKQHA